MHYAPDPALGPTEEQRRVVQAQKEERRRAHEATLALAQEAKARRLEDKRQREEERRNQTEAEKEERRIQTESLKEEKRQKVEERRIQTEALKEERRIQAEALKAAKEQKRQENMRRQAEIQQKAAHDRAEHEVVLTCESLMAIVESQIRDMLGEELVRMTPSSFAGGDLAWTLRFKDTASAQACLNMTLPSLQLNLPLAVKPPILDACFLHFDVPEELNVLAAELIPSIQALFSEFGAVVHVKVLPNRVALILFQDPGTAQKVIDQQAQRTFFLLGQPLPGFVCGKRSKRKRG
jgi:hypothetical protein